MKRVLLRVLLVVLILLVAIQLVPYGRSHDNPPVTGEPSWDSPRTRELVQRACFDCHSHETKWPWYASIAPISWMVQHDVDEGREHLNFSTWDVSQRNGDETAEEVEDGEMPLKGYLLAHPEARLEGKEREELLRGLRATFPEKEGRGRGRGGRDDEGDDDDR